jgi:hypothetical protein
MMKFKQRTICTAKDGPATCRNHGTPGVTADSLYQSYLSDQPSGKVNQALTSELNWDGKPPRWWKKYSKDLAHHSHLPTTAKILDVIDSPAGKLAVIWQDKSHEVNDVYVTHESGQNVSICYYKSVETGETLGYMKTSTVTDESMKHSYGDDEFTPFRFDGNYALRTFGHGTKFKPMVGVGLEGEELNQKRREVWFKAVTTPSNRMQVMHEGKVVPSYELSEKHIPDDATVQKDLASLSKKFTQQMDERKAWFKNPYIDYSSVEHPLRGKGFGAALYIYTARHLATKGQVLVGSSTQTDEAKTVWSRFQAKLPNQVSTTSLTYEGEIKEYRTLDFRK